MSTPGPLSATMVAALNETIERGGKLVRHPGGYWTEPGAVMSGYGRLFDWSIGTCTIQALIRREALRYTDWRDGRSGRFPIAAEVVRTPHGLARVVFIEDQPHYPFQFHKADAMTFPLEGFDFIWASPPCQAYTLCQRIRDNNHPELIGPTRDRLKAAGVPWCIENVVGAPLCNPIELCGAMFGLRVYRHRLFECSFPIIAPPHPEHVAPLRKMGRPPKPGEFMHVVGNFSGVKQAREAMDIPWMPRDKLREAIPPAFSAYVAKWALGHINSRYSEAAE